LIISGASGWRRIEMRLRAYAAIIAIMYTFLFMALFYVQIVRYEKYKIMSEENRLRVIPLLAPRGGIYDRNSKPIVKDELSFNASVIYSQVKDKAALASCLSRVLDLPESKVTEQFKKSRKSPFILTPIATNIGMDKAIDIEEITMDYPGLVLDVMPRRSYASGKTASNMIGYLGYINREEFTRLKHYGYSVNDLVGRDGIEGQYDDYLRGTYGGKQLEVDSRGREVNTLGFKEPIAGKDIYLTVDLELQKFCDEAIAGRKGAVIVMDPNTGAVLAMASAPGYDPSIFTDPQKKAERSNVLSNSDYPLLNRAISGAYPPGSVFKMIVATAALECGKETENTTFICPGYFRLGRGIWKCWKKDGGHGPQVMRDAIKNSCDVFFYNTGLIIGVDVISEYAGMFGIGSLTRIDLPGEVPGILPSQAWKKRRLKEDWYKGDTVNFSIGQGYLICSPIQMARFVSAFANGGYLVRPHIVDRIEDVPVASSEQVDLKIDPRNLQVVREGLYKVVNESGGTGVRAQVEGVKVAGKTGTAQTTRGLDHGWFAGFAPFDNPKVAIVVFDEYGGKGGHYAAGTAGKILTKAKELGIL
jgi:penicillin-binding protein 2